MVLLGKILKRISFKEDQMIKKYLGIISLFVLLLLTGCTEVIGENQFALPNLNNKSKAEIEEILANYDVQYVIYFEEGIYQEKDYDKFVRYGNGKKAGNAVDNGSFIRIYMTPLHLNYKRSDEVKIDFEYEGKSFINDGVGEVTLVSTTDGDTARFYDPIADQTIRVRFLGINTPETSIRKDPWGKAASDYAKNRLRSAKKIVLEAEEERKDTYNRYLGFVWLDGELYNLQVVEEAYSKSICSESSKYYQYFIDVDLNVSKTGRRVFGEIDPGYDYENKKFI